MLNNYSLYIYFLFVLGLSSLQISFDASKVHRVLKYPLTKRKDSEIIVMSRDNVLIDNLAKNIWFSNFLEG